MARVFITGSSDGLGRMAAQLLVAQGHRVVLHARDAARAADARAAVPEADDVLLGDLASIRETVALAEAANAHGRFDAVIHNAAVGYKEKQRRATPDGLPHVFAVNTLAPFILTALVERPPRLVYVSSELHRRGTSGTDDLLWERRRWHGNQAYSDSKLHDVLLAFAVARRWPDVQANAMEPGWVATKMSPRATGDLDKAHRTQVWLATVAAGSGGYFFHEQPQAVHRRARDVAVQDALVAACERLSGIALPA